MTKKLCKSLRKDGQPCQGPAQPGLDGYCLAHAPADKTFAWRSRGGKASSNTARAEKRMPEQLRGISEKLAQAMDDTLEGQLEPAALSAVIRGAHALMALHRFSQDETDIARADEIALVAAQVIGASGDPGALDAADKIAAWQNQYIIDSLIQQGLVTQRGNDPPKYRLTTAGRQRFRYQRLTEHTQQDFDELMELAALPDTGVDSLLSIRSELGRVRRELEKFLADDAPDAAPVLHPISAQPLSQLPAGVKPASVRTAGPQEAEQAAAGLRRLLLQAKKGWHEITQSLTELNRRRYAELSSSKEQDK